MEIFITGNQFLSPHIRIMEIYGHNRIDLQSLVRTISAVIDKHRAVWQDNIDTK